MLGEGTLSESDLESLDISNYYNGNENVNKTKCSLLKKLSLRSYCYCCLGSSFYISSCIISFYIGLFTEEDYGKTNHCNKTIWELIGVQEL